MKIGKPADVQQTDALSRPGHPAAGAASGASRSDAVDKVAGTDAVRLSQTSRNLASEGATDEMPVRAAKVAEVQAALREGRFEVDAQAVADKMIAQAAELLETLSRRK